MAETDIHRKVLLDLDFALRHFFGDDPNVYVAGNLLVYFVEGDPAQSVAPDVFVVKGVPKHDRRIFKIWEEGKAPDVVIEVTSAGTRREDLGDKRALYEELGVQEYFLFDPLGEYLEPRLKGYRLAGGEFRPMEGEPLRSEALDLELRVEGGRLRLYDPARAEYLLSPEEEAAARRQAEAEVERLRAELERLKRGGPG